MRIDLQNTACRRRIEGRKGHKDAQKDAERHPKSRSLSEAELSDAVERVSTASLTVFGALLRRSFSPDASRRRYCRLCNPVSTGRPAPFRAPSERGSAGTA